MSDRYAADLAKGRARAAVLGAGMDWQALGLRAAIIAPRPRYAMAGVTAAMDPGPAIAPGIHPSAVIDPHSDRRTRRCDRPLRPYRPRRPDRAQRAHRLPCQHRRGCADRRRRPDPRGCPHRRAGRIGHRVIIQPGAVLGGDGFSFVTPEQSHVETARESLGTADHTAQGPQSWTRIHSLGGLVIGDDVEIGANAAIDRGTIADTTIGDGTKIDNLVHIGHNCRIGRDCLLCGQVGFAGSAVVGDRVVLGGQCGVSDNIEIGSDVVAAGATKIYSNVPPGRMLMGSPAVKLDTHVEMYKALRRLPRLARTVAELQKAVFKSDRTP
jgi:UDP-3-O-[3-hydroxymyristoyl] glucosamine N-acyltransferase